MAGRFPIFADACLRGSFVEGLVRRGWDVRRAIDAFPEGTKDPRLFEYAVEAERVFVTNDGPIERMALRWACEKRPFPGLIFWRIEDYGIGTIGDFLDAFDRLAAQDEPFSNWPLCYLAQLVREKA